MYSLTYGAELTQTVERQTRNAGSKPTSGATFLVSIFYLLEIVYNKHI